MHERIINFPVLSPSPSVRSSQFSFPSLRMGCSCDLSRLGIPSAHPLLLGTVDPSNPEPGSGRFRGTSLLLDELPTAFPGDYLAADLCWEMEEDTQDSKLRKSEPRETGRTHCPFLTLLQKLVASSRSLSGCPRFVFFLGYSLVLGQSSSTEIILSSQPLRSHPIFCLLPSFPDFYCTTDGESGIAACRQRTGLKAEQDFFPIAP